MFRVYPKPLTLSVPDFLKLSCPAQELATLMHADEKKHALLLQEYMVALCGRDPRVTAIGSLVE